VVFSEKKVDFFRRRQSESQRQQYKMSDFECSECNTVTADDERVWIATKCECGEGEDCAECGYDVCMKCEDACNKREAEDGNAREYKNDEEEDGKGKDRCGCCRKQMPEGDTWCCEGKCGLFTCPDCRPASNEGACVICVQEQGEESEDEKEYTCGKKCECTHCQRNRPTCEDGCKCDCHSEGEEDEDCCDCINHGDDGCKCDCHSEDEEGEEGDQCEECHTKAATRCEMCGDSLCNFHTRRKDKDSAGLCKGCFGKEEDEQDDMKSHPCECGLKECSDCFQEEGEKDGDGFVICSKCGKGGGKCYGDCEKD